eukprot:TRINITY_DN273_c0_g1_i1.p1 TRINITY_DN273_c0_g1~~TRINITY_DN273_c0_g1_i1.p1  ORF type:complete len:572 (+),score=145.60 TRINITY_DN273_c0_g1_i1:252-1967(+)
MDGKRGRGGGRGAARGQRGTAAAGRKPSGVFASIASRGRAQRPTRGGRGGRGNGVDAEGDVKMEGANTLTRWHSNRESNTRIGTNISITGFAANDDKTKIIEFLSSKSSIPANFISSTLEDKRIIAELNTTAQALAVVKLNRIKYRGNPLNIKFDTAGSVNSNLSKKLTPLIESKYNAAVKLLDLSQLGGTDFDGTTLDFNRDALIKAIFLAVSTKCPNVVSIDLSANGISSLRAFHSLDAVDLSSIQNISLKGNNISSFDELDNLKSFKLREIILSNNPIQANSNNPNVYKTEIQSRFEGISYIDGEQLEQISFGLGNVSKKVNLPPVKAFFYEMSAIQQLAEAFLKKFLDSYDNDRNTLLDVYTDTSVFSLSCSGIPSLNNTKKVKIPRGMYSTVSRNLQITSNLDAHIQIGRVDIIHFMKTLPATKHQFDDVRIDAFVLSNINASNVVSISIHGHFTEGDGKITRSYDRSFLLTPAGNDSAASLKGWNVVVMNEQLHIRPHNPLPVIPPETTPNAPSNDIVANLVTQTRLKTEFASQLLAVHQGQYEAALLDFQQAQQQGKITPDMLQ